MAVAGTNIVQSRRDCDGSGCNSNVEQVSWTVNPTATASVLAIPGCGTGTIRVSSSLSGVQTFNLCDNSCVIIAQWLGIGSSHDFTGLADGTYRGIVKQIITNCTSECCTGATLTNYTIPTAYAGPDTTICYGSNTILTATGAGGGGSYSWNTGDITQSIEAYTLIPFIYIVTVTTAQGCTDIDNVLLIIKPFPDILVNTNTSATCYSMDENSWVYYVDASNKVLAAVKDYTDGSILASTDVFSTMYAGIQYLNGDPYLPRVISIQPTNFVPTRVKLFFLKSELQLLRDAIGDPLLQYDDLAVTKFDNGTFNNGVYYDKDDGTAFFFNTTDTGLPGDTIYSVEIEVSNFSDFYIHKAKGFPLPIELLSFRAKCDKDVVNIEWTTASEINNDFFTLEKSTDLQNFEIVTTVDGAGTTNEIKYYSYTDENPCDNISYYRLKQTDFDGAFKYSDIEIVDCSGLNNPDVIFYPNPFKDELVVRIININSTKANIEIYDMLGSKVFESNLSNISDNDRYTINLSRLSPAVYFIKFVSDSFLKTDKIYKK